MTRISEEKKAKLNELISAGTGNVGRSISPFGDRSIPQALGGDSLGLKPIELLDDLAPCGYAYACTIDLTFDPPKPDYTKMFLVKDFFGLFGLAGWQGWADPIARKMSGSGSDSSSEDEFYPLVNIGPPCDEGSSFSSFSSSSLAESSELESEESSSSPESSFSSSASLPESSESSFPEESSGSSKDTAIVPADFTSGGYTALYVREADEVLFDHRLRGVWIDKLETFLPIHPYFLKVCEPETFSVVCQPHLAVAHGAEVIGDRLRIELASAARPVRFDITITGVRKGFNDHKYFYPSYTRAQFEANERRIQGS